MNTDRVVKRTTTIYKSFREDGTLETEEHKEEIEYEQVPVNVAPFVPGQHWWQNPVISYGSNTTFAGKPVEDLDEKELAAYGNYIQKQLSTSLNSKI